MKRDRYRAGIEDLLDRAGILVDGGRPWDITVHNDQFYKRVALCGSLGLGESYMDGWWECERIDGMIFRILRAGIDAGAETWRGCLNALCSRILNPQRISCAFTVGKRHYDRGNDLFHIMLDKRMIYSCGYWREAEDLDGAQEAKLNLVARKLHLMPGMWVLDIGCGWGGTAKFMAERYGVRVVGLTVSEEQARFARSLCAGLPVEIRLADYRSLAGRFDRIFSIGMFEHVGWRNYRTYMDVVRRCLKDDGLFLLHTIGRNVSGTTLDPWMERYIFPRSMLPSLRQIAAAAEGILVMEDLHNFGLDYDRTLMCWRENFERGWDRLKDRYDERFRRMWRYYLLACAGSFRARQTHVWQIVFSLPCSILAYDPVR